MLELKDEEVQNNFFYAIFRDCFNLIKFLYPSPYVKYRTNKFERSYTDLMIRSSKVKRYILILSSN